MKAVRTRRALAAAVVVLMVGVTAACDDDEPVESGGKTAVSSAEQKAADKSPEAETGAEAGTEASPSKGSKGSTESTYTEADLQKQIIAKGDVDKYEVSKPAASELRGGSVKSAPSACQPLAALVQNSGAGYPQAYAYRQLVAANAEDMSGTGVLVGLSSYAEGEAESAMADVREAVEACGDGFRTSAADGDSEYVGVTVEDGAAGADETVAFELTGALDGDEVPLKYSLARKGSSIAFFYSMNPFEPSEAEIDTTVITAQIAKLK